jgi:hypothetical protein
MAKPSQTKGLSLLHTTVHRLLLSHRHVTKKHHHFLAHSAGLALRHVHSAKEPQLRDNLPPCEARQNQTSAFFQKLLRMSTNAAACAWLSPWKAVHEEVRSVTAIAAIQRTVTGRRMSDLRVAFCTLPVAVLSSVRMSRRPATWHQEIQIGGMHEHCRCQNKASATTRNIESISSPHNHGNKKVVVILIL